jgi:Beta-lactamase superfamily domain
MQLTKLNADSSWLWTIDGLRVLVDPWFTESQVDFHPWFSRQFHLDEQPSVATLQKPDFIFISHRYTDHCNRQTLLQLDANIQLIATRQNLVHKAYLVTSSTGKLLYAPHGAKLKQECAAQIVIASTLRYELPFFMGGVINLGLKAAMDLKENLRAQHLLCTHAENKRAEGLVAALAKKKFQKDAGVTYLNPGETFSFDPSEIKN